MVRSEEAEVPQNYARIGPNVRTPEEAVAEYHKHYAQVNNEHVRVLTKALVDIEKTANSRGWFKLNRIRKIVSDTLQRFRS